jgi:hydroxymethylpyrimidine/phosphomethylpyrimidine kinase
MMSISKTYHKVLTIAGSDSGGGAGIQADLKTFAALGCYGMSVVTALTAQNTQGVTAVHAPPVEFIRKQLEAVFDDIGADAVKIGMLYSKDVIETVSEALKKYRAKNIVLDPVMAAQSGDALTQGEVIAAMKQHLLPMVTLFTPNLPEAALFLGREITTPEEMHQAARDLTAYGAGSVLLKGGHLKTGESTDVLFIGPEDRFVTLEGKHIATRNDHGTGCTLSSAVAGFLAEGDSLEEACWSAKTFLQAAIEAGAEYEIGRGHGPVHHFFKYW